MRIAASGFVLGFMALAALSPQPSRAMSAFAAGIPDDVAQDGVAMGESHNYSTREAAEDRALQMCRSNQDSSEKVHALCKVIDHFDNRCLATALDPKAGTPGWGWAITNVKTDANDQALSMCRQSAGADRAPYCVVSLSECDGSASSQN